MRPHYPQTSDNGMLDRGLDLIDVVRLEAHLQGLRECKTQYRWHWTALTRSSAIPNSLSQSLE
jgi:hypothetical protein